MTIVMLHANAQTYFLNGTAISLGNDCYQLTTTLGYQNGTVWYADQIDLNEPFNLEYRMNFGNLDANGADGMCFVLQTVGTGAIGDTGGGMGYLNFGTSLGIEFDTWQNGEYNDPVFDHVAIEKNGDINHLSVNNIAGPVQISSLNANVEDGQNHVVEITWDPATFIMQVYFDCEFRLEGTVDLINSVFGGSGIAVARGGLDANLDVTVEHAFKAPTFLCAVIPPVGPPACGDASFTQTTLDSHLKFPTFGTQTFEFRGHALFTGGNTLPPQRFAYLGGVGTLATVNLLALGGDRLLYFMGDYVVPIDRIVLPFVGSPFLALTYAAGTAGVGSTPPLIQNLGVGAGVSLFRVDYTIDPAQNRSPFSRKSAWSFGLSLSL